MRHAIALAALVAATPARGDSWRSPAETTVKSANGSVVAKLRPADLVARLDSKPMLVVERAGKKVFERVAVNRIAPVTVLVSDDGHVVTLGEWHRYGHEHSLVIYNPRGDVVIDRRLEELIEGDELAKTERSVSSRWWLQRGADATLKGDRVVVPTLWGEELHFLLADGSQLRGGRPFIVPSDRDRFTEYATGKRAFSHVSIDYSDPTMRCSLGPTGGSCEAIGEKKPATTTTYTARQLTEALAAMAPFGAAIAPHFAPALPGELRTVIIIDFTDGSKTPTHYGYRIVIPGKARGDAEPGKARGDAEPGKARGDAEPGNSPAALAAPLQALRRLAGLAR